MGAGIWERILNANQVALLANARDITLVIRDSDAGIRSNKIPHIEVMPSGPDPADRIGLINADCMLDHLVCQLSHGTITSRCSSSGKEREYRMV